MRAIRSKMFGWRSVAAVFAVEMCRGGAAVAALDSCGDFGATVERIRFVAERWVDEEGLRRIADIEPPLVWTSERAEKARAALLRTNTFRSVELRVAADEGSCALFVDLRERPIVEKVELRGVARPRVEALRAFLRWVTFRKERAPLPTVREVERLLPFRIGAFFEASSIDRSSQRILARYHALGYYAASVSTRAVEERGGVTVEVFVSPGLPVMVAEVAARADDGEAREIAEEVLGELVGTPRMRGLERDTRQKIVRRLREAGFFDAHVDCGWEALDATVGRLTAEIEAGPRFTIEIEGNESIDRDDLLASEGLLERVIVTDNTWRQLARAMERQYQEKGYFEAKVDLDRQADDHLVYRIHEGRRFSAEPARFVGNEAVSDDELLEVVGSGERGWLWPIVSPRLTDTEIRADTERILGLYEERGYEAAAVTSAVETNEDDGTSTVTFLIDEGVRSWVSEVEVTGAPDGWAKELAEAFAGKPLDLTALETERKARLGELQQMGHLDAAMDVDLVRDEAGDRVEVRVVWKVEPGALHRIGDIVVQENAETQYTVVRRDLPFEPGEPVQTEKLLDAQQDVYGAGVFRNVSILPVPLSKGEEGADEADDQDDPEVIDRTVAVRVTPRPPGRLSYGLGYDTLQGITGFGELRYLNLNRRAQSLRLRAQLGFDPGKSRSPTQYLATAGFIEPRLLDGPWDWQLNGLAERNTRTTKQYSVERFSFATGSSRDIVEDLRFGGDLQVERANVFDVKPIPFRERDAVDTWTTAVSPFLLYDGRDNAFNPTEGFFEALRIRYALPGISQTDLIEVNVQHTQLIPLWSDWGLVYSLRAGYVHSLDGNPIVPIRQRYFLGGGESVRGFAVNSLGPYDGAGNDVGGDLALVAKTELRIPVWGALGLVLFVDGGGNYLVRCDAECRAGDPSDPDTQIRDAAFTFDNFRFTAGAGVRYVTPIGPISVDYGVKLDRRTRELSDGATARESFGEFSISVGARF